MTGKPGLSVAATLLLLSVAATACARVERGETSTPQNHPSSSFSSAGSVAYTDVAFVQTMIAHDRQTVRICTLLLDKQSVDPSVRTVADRMRMTRSREIETLVTWLRDWGLDEAPVDHDHGGSHGLLLPGQVLRFQRADGPTAQAAFIEVMIQRDVGVRALAEPVASNGSNTEIRNLAETIVADGDVELSELEPLRGHG